MTPDRTTTTEPGAVRREPGPVDGRMSSRSHGRRPTLGPGEIIAALSALLLFAFMFLDWFGADAINGGPGSGAGNAWDWFSFIDILLLLAILVAIGAAVARAVAGRPGLGPVIAAAGAVALALIVFRLVAPGDGFFEAAIAPDRKLGPYLGALAALGMTLGGILASRERTRGGVRR